MYVYSALFSLSQLHLLCCKSMCVFFPLQFVEILLLLLSSIFFSFIVTTSFMATAFTPSSPWWYQCIYTLVERVHSWDVLCSLYHSVELTTFLFLPIVCLPIRTHPNNIKLPIFIASIWTILEGTASEVEKTNEEKNLRTKRKHDSVHGQSKWSCARWSWMWLCFFSILFYFILN